MIDIAPLPHDPVVQDETAFILDDAHRNARFNRNTGLAPRDPPRVSLEHGKHLLVMGNGLALEQTAHNPVHPLPRIADVTADQVRVPAPGQTPEPGILHPCQGAFGTIDKDLPQIHARTARVMADMGSRMLLRKRNVLFQQIPCRPIRRVGMSSRHFRLILMYPMSMSPSSEWGLMTCLMGQDPVKNDGFRMKKGPETGNAP